MNRIDIINSLIQKNGFKTYLEIGVEDGFCFFKINCQTKVGLDPDVNSKATLFLTSDDFFKSNQDKFDIIFIDGLHHADQVEKDILNSLKVLSEHGIIVVHDCLPTSKEIQEVPRSQDVWTGDTWKAFLKIRKNSNLETYVVDTDWGCGLIKHGKRPVISSINTTYEEFCF